MNHPIHQMAKISGSMDLECWPMPMLLDFDLTIKTLRNLTHQRWGDHLPNNTKWGIRPA